MTSFLGLAYDLIGYPENEFEAMIILLLASVIAFTFLMTIYDVFHFIASALTQKGNGGR